MIRPETMRARRRWQVVNAGSIVVLALALTGCLMADTGGDETEATRDEKQGAVAGVDDAGGLVVVPTTAAQVDGASIFDEVEPPEGKEEASAGSAAAAGEEPPAAELPWEPGEAIIPKKLFARRGLGKQVLESNPHVYLYPGAERATGRRTLIIGMPGWGGRSENFIWNLINGLDREELAPKLVVASIQDTNSGGPRYQGQGDRAHANVWTTTRRSVTTMHHFIERLAASLGELDVYFAGFSTGGVSAPLMASKVARHVAPESGVRIRGAIALGTGSRVRAAALAEHDLAVLFLVVPKRERDDPKPLRDDQWNRQSAEIEFERLLEAGSRIHLRHIHSAKRHVDWHWGLVSQCRYFKGSRIDDGRGYWPNYWMPNPETMAAIAAFLQGQPIPAEGASSAVSSCPY